MMYDFEIMVPTETKKDSIMKRIEDFKKVGFHNHSNYRIALYLAASPHKSEEDVRFLNQGWPDNFDVTVLNTPYSHCAPQIYWYYARCIKPGRAKWYVRLDDDSLTDIDGLNKNLDRRFDHTMPFHIGGELLQDLQDTDVAILTSLGYGHFYGCHPNHKEVPPHEHEISVTSNAAIKVLTENPTAMSYFEIRKEFVEGYGDHGLCHALRICKIYPTSVPFLTANPESINFSIFGGFRNHIHHISHDRNNKILRWIEIFDRTPSEEDNRTYLFGRKNEPKTWLRLTADKTARVMKPVPWSGGASGQIVGLWCMLSDDTLGYYTPNEHEPLIYFKKKEDKSWAFENWELNPLDLGL